MKNRLRIIIALTFIFLPMLTRGESGCRYEDRFDSHCMFVWFIYGCFDSIPSALFIILLGWILRKVKIIKSKLEAWILNISFITSVITFAAIQSCFLSDLHIYYPGPEGRWNYIRDFLLIPFLGGALVYVCLWLFLRSKRIGLPEKRTGSNSLNPRSVHEDEL